MFTEVDTVSLLGFSADGLHAGFKEKNGLVGLFLETSQWQGFWHRLIVLSAPLIVNSRPR